MPAFYNHATLSYNDIVINSNTVQGNLNASLSIDKDAVHDSYRHGDMITYALNFVNTGSSDANNLHLYDDLGAYDFNMGSLVPLDYVDGSVKYYVNGEQQDAPDTDAGAPLHIRGIRVPAGGNASLLYTVRVNHFAPMGQGSVLNTATLQRNSNGMQDAGDAAAQNRGGHGKKRPCDKCDDRTQLPISALEEIFPETSPLLTITKSLCPKEVSPCEPLTYTLTIENTGTTAITAEDNVVVTDTFDPILNITSVTFNGEDWNEPANYTYNENTGLFSTVAGQITVPAATFAQDAESGEWMITPGVSTIEITGMIS